jgi:4-hydroxybenzoate polyprenyltransferase
MNKLIAYLRLIRPINCLMMGFAVIVGAALASPVFMHCLEKPCLWIHYWFYANSCFHGYKRLL